MKKILFTGLAASAFAFTSCGDKKEEASTGVDKAGLNATEAVENWKTDVTEGKIVSLWDSLPGSYQADVSGLAHSLGDKVDPEVYDKSMETMMMAAKLLKDKKAIVLEIISESLPAAQDMDSATMEANYDSLVGLLNTVTNSDMKDVEGLKKLDMQKFLGQLEGNIADLMTLPVSPDAPFTLSDLKSMTTKVLSETADAAELELTVKDETEQLKLNKVEDRWVPAEMSASWSEKMIEAKSAIAQIGDMEPMQKGQILGGLTMAQGLIESLNSANTKEEMQMKAMMAAGQFMGQ